MLVATTALSLVACADTSWVYDYDGIKIPAGVYIASSMTAYAKVQSHEDFDTANEDIFAQTIDDKTAKQWILDETKKTVDGFIAVERKFDEMGLILTESDENIIETKTASTLYFY